MPVCFGISFTKTPMNQARSLVHVYTDGSVAVSTGAVEMGQGVNTKMAQVAAKMFGLPIEQIKVHTTNTLRIANTSPTAASAAADLNGKATQIACETILERLIEVAKDLVKDDAFRVQTSVCSASEARRKSRLKAGLQTRFRLKTVLFIATAKRRVWIGKDS